MYLPTLVNPDRQTAFAQTHTAPTASSCFPLPL